MVAAMQRMRSLTETATTTTATPFALNVREATVVDVAGTEVAAMAEAMEVAMAAAAVVMGVEDIQEDTEAGMTEDQVEEGTRRSRAADLITESL